VAVTSQQPWCSTIDLAKEKSPSPISRIRSSSGMKGMVGRCGFFASFLAGRWRSSLGLVGSGFTYGALRRGPLAACLPFMFFVLAMAVRYVLVEL
jgi:hypothetical protein